MDDPGPLADFLRARRSRLLPDEVGLTFYGTRRRVEGLRSEELAHLAGVSVSYYTRLEQGVSRSASDDVLQAIGRALQLDPHENEHLKRLAGTARTASKVQRPPRERISPETRDLFRALENVPVLVLGRRTEVLAWNMLGHLLLAGHVAADSVDVAAARPNMTRMMFLDGHSRELYVDWPRKARAVVGNLRMMVGRYPDDPILVHLVGELTVKSPEFVALWSDHRIAPCDAASYDLHHPLIGDLTVTQQTLSILRSPDQSLVVVTTAAGTSSEHALTLLRHSASNQTHTLSPQAISPTHQ